MEKKMDKKIVIEEYLQGNISYNDFLTTIVSKRSGDLVQFIFDEIETKKQVIIEQYY